MSMVIATFLIGLRKNMKKSNLNRLDDHSRIQDQDPSRYSYVRFGLFNLIINWSESNPILVTQY